jgi:hypothetical protein
MAFGQTNPTDEEVRIVARVLSNQDEKKDFHRSCWKLLELFKKKQTQQLKSYLRWIYCCVLRRINLVLKSNVAKSNVKKLWFYYKD